MTNTLITAFIIMACCTASAQDSTRVGRAEILSTCSYFLDNPVVSSKDAESALTKSGFMNSGIDSDVWLWQHPALPEYSPLDLASFWEMHQDGEEMEAPEYFWELKFRGIALEIVEGEEYVGSCVFALPASYLADIILIAQDAGYTLGNTKSSRCDSITIETLHPAMFRLAMNNDSKRVRLLFWLIEDFILIKQLLL